MEARSGDSKLSEYLTFFFPFELQILVLKTDSQDLVASFRVTTGTSNTTAIKSIEFARKGRWDLVFLGTVLEVSRMQRYIENHSFCVYYTYIFKKVYWENNPEPAVSGS